MLFTFLLFSLLFTTRAQECSCTRSGISNGIDTGRPGCVLEDSADTPACFVESSDNCPDARASDDVPGAFIIDCSFKEALFFAAETDDLETVLLFRERGSPLNITQMASNGFGEEESFQLVAYAAAYGSFRVVEDLLINADYECGVGIHPENVLCLFSDDDLCADDESQEGILSLIRFTYGRTCMERTSPAGPSASVPASFSSSATSSSSDRTVAAALVIPAQCGSHPYFVSIRSSFNGGYDHRCGGVLVANDTVLTAAHCVDGSQGVFEPILLIEAYTRQGAGFCNENSDIRKATQIVLHPKWSEGRYARSVGNGRDVALLKLNEPSFKQPIKIASRKTLTVGERLRFVGMGRVSSSGAFAQELNIMTLDAVDPETCQEAYPGGVASDILCVGGEAADFCVGDDGGPLFRTSSNRDILVGIAHLKHPSAGCGTRGIPGLYANAAKLRKWIRRTRNNQF